MPLLGRMIDSIGAGSLQAPAFAAPLYQTHLTVWRTSGADFDLVESRVKPDSPWVAMLRACLEPNPEPFFACIQTFSRGLSSGMLPGDPVQGRVESLMGSPRGGLIRSRGRASGRGRRAPGFRKTALHGIGWVVLQRFSTARVGGPASDLRSWRFRPSLAACFHNRYEDRLLEE